MKTFFAVVHDLLHFAFNAVFPTVEVSDKDQIKPDPLQLSLPKPEELKKLPESPSSKYLTTPSTTPLRYFVREEAVKVFSRPVATFDGVLMKLTLGSEVVVLSFMGRFAEIRWQGDETAWILKDDLTTEEGEVFPLLTNGQSYLADNTEVKKLRRLLKDEFSTEALYLPLQDVEMVTYYLKQSGRSISWPPVRPRLSGIWHNLLKGQSGINISVAPIAGGVMEYIDGEVGFLAYTKEVLVDNSIVIFGVGRKQEGEYLVEHLSEKDWQALRPVWISLI